MADCVYGKDGYDVPDLNGGGRPAADAGGAGNMGASVTPHVLITEVKDFQFLICGIDTLDLSLAVTWKDFYSGLSKELSEGKREAQRQDKSVILNLTTDGLCAIYPRGKGSNYAYHLEHTNFHFYIASSEDGRKFQNVYVSFKSKSIWLKGLTSLFQEISTFVHDLGGEFEDSGVIVSRCDLCADYFVPDGISFSFLRDHAVSRSRKSNQYLDGDNLETYYIGSRQAPVQARIYDKAKELLKSEKHWFFEIWEIAPCRNVWRVEFQLRRPALKEYGVTSIEQLIGRLAGIWRNLTENWLCLRLQDDSNTCRRTLHPWWKSVQDCATEFGPLIQVEREVRNGGAANHEFFLSRAARCFLAYAAIMGFHELEQGLYGFTDAIRRYWEDRDFEQERLLKTLEIGKIFERTGGYDDIPF